MPGEAERVVFDCVIFAQAIINPYGPAGKCLEMAREGALTVCISDYLIGEIRELPGKLVPRLNITPQKIDELVLDLLSFGRQLKEVPEAYTLERDPDDSHYINLAIAANAKLITSRDRDLLDLMEPENSVGREFQIRFPHLLILTPESLLRHLAQR